LHIDFANWADGLLIAPCSANTIAKIASGFCDNLLTSIVRAWDFENKSKKIFVAPACNTKMWKHPLMWEHMLRLEEWEIRVIDPVSKKLACGEVGVGAMEDIDKIYNIVANDFKADSPYVKRKVRSGDELEE
jgi:phosphopantothenoylcysteine synthetase/decarboxylase